MNFFLSTLKWAPSRIYFGKMYDTLSFTEIWRTSISLKWTNYLMWFLQRLKCLITIVVRDFTNPCRHGCCCRIWLEGRFQCVIGLIVNDTDVVSYWCINYRLVTMPHRNFGVGEMIYIWQASITEDNKAAHWVVLEYLHVCYLFCCALHFLTPIGIWVAH